MAHAFDVNGDGLTTITDVIAWIEAMFEVPAKLALTLLDGWPAVGGFFEVSCTSGQGWGGALFSAIVWLCAFGGFLRVTNR
jgi:hypothetical protein